MTRMLKLLNRRQGQNTVEYLLMLAVVIAVVIIVGGMIKTYLPNLASQIQGMLEDATSRIKG